MKPQLVLTLSLVLIIVIVGIIFFVFPPSEETETGIKTALVVSILSFLASLFGSFNDIIDIYKKLVTEKGRYDGIKIETKASKLGTLKLFLCHASPDKPAVIQLYDRLKADHYEPWLDKLDLLPGQDWDYEIRKAVSSCHIVIACLSSRSINKAGYIQREITHALDIAEQQPKGTIYLIPLRLENCELPERLCRWQWVNYYEEDGYQTLIKALEYRAKTLGIKLPGKEKEISVKSPKITPKSKPSPLQPKTREDRARNINWLKISHSRVRKAFLWKRLKSWVMVVMGIIGAAILLWAGYQLYNAYIEPRILISRIPSPTATITIIHQAQTILATSTLASTPMNTSTLEVISSPTPKHTFSPTTTPSLSPSSMKTPTPEPTLRIGSTRISPADEKVMMYVPAGEFLMGSADTDSMARFDEKPQRSIFLNAFWIDQTEITNAEYAKCVSSSACKEPERQSSTTRDSYYKNPEFQQYPVIYVTWEDAANYCSWADKRLPTEAEWEKAARGTEGSIYPNGYTPPNCNLANGAGCLGDTVAVGSYPNGVSPYRVMDMIGNVSEWVSDWYQADYYKSSPPNNPIGPSDGNQRLVRGGGCHYDSHLRVAYRYPRNPNHSGSATGFRCVISLSSATSHTSKRETVADNEHIIFTTDRDGNDEIYIMDTDGSNQINLTNNSAFDGFPTWSPDGQFILFVTNRDGNYEIYKMNADGSNPINLSKDKALDQDPLWSPDGKQIVFASDRTGNRDIFVMDSDGYHIKNISNHNSVDEHHVWSPNGKFIAFSSDRETVPSIFLYDLQNSILTNVTKNNLYSYEPIWSFDNQKIVFQSISDDAESRYKQDRNYTTYIMNIDGTKRTSIGRSTDIVWSRDGKKIAFIKIDGYFSWNIYIMNSDFSEQYRLTPHYGVENEPKWSNKGDQIIYTLNQGANDEIYLANIDGSNFLNLTNSPKSNERDPDWQPLIK